MSIERKPDGTFERGVSGNPKGRPKRQVEERALSQLVDLLEGEQWAKIVSAMIKRAQSGDVQAARWISEYLIGKPSQTINVQAQPTRLVLPGMDDEPDAEELEIMRRLTGGDQADQTESAK